MHGNTKKRCYIGVFVIIMILSVVAFVITNHYLKTDRNFDEISRFLQFAFPDQLPTNISGDAPYEKWVPVMIHSAAHHGFIHSPEQVNGRLQLTVGQLRENMKAFQGNGSLWLRIGKWDEIVPRVLFGEYDPKMQAFIYDSCSIPSEYQYIPVDYSEIDSDYHVATFCYIECSEDVTMFLADGTAINAREILGLSVADDKERLIEKARNEIKRNPEKFASIAVEFSHINQKLRIYGFQNDLS